MKGTRFGHWLAMRSYLIDLWILRLDSALRCYKPTKYRDSLLYCFQSSYLRILSEPVVGETRRKGFIWSALLRNAAILAFWRYSFSELLICWCTCDSPQLSMVHSVSHTPAQGSFLMEHLMGPVSCRIYVEKLWFNLHP